MNKSKKITLIISIALVSILLIVGISYAAMSYNKAGSNQQLVLGDIWMKYDEVSGLSISDALPGADYSNYFEFTITGKNTYTKKDIYYDFILTRGDLPEGKSEDYRIPDEYLKFKLVSVDNSNQETVIFQDETYESLENQRIYVETIAKNTTDEVNRKYRLYMTIDYSLEIGNTSTAVFTSDEWEQAFATVKLNVTGDFSEKKVLTYEDCFKTKILDDGTLKITDYYKYNASSTNELYQNPFCTSDVVIPRTIGGVSVTAIGRGAFENNDLTSIEIPDSVISIESRAFNSNRLSDSEATIYARTDNNGDGVGEIDTTTIVSYGGLNKSPVISNNVTTIGDSAFHGNELRSVVIPDSVTAIGPNAFSYNRLVSVEISKNITIIESDTFYNNQLTSIEIPNGVTEIGYSAFGGNLLTSVRIPNSVKTIQTIAFYRNNITNLTFEENSKLKTIEQDAFYMNEIVNVEIPDSVETIASNAFADNYINEVVLGNSIQYIGHAAFGTHGGYYSGNNMITTVINKSGNSFDWDVVFGFSSSSDDNNNFSAGTYNFYYEGEETEIKILVPTPESCFTTTSLDSTSVSITDYDTSCGTDVVIPSKIAGKNVTTIGWWAFKEKNLTSVVIPEGVITIENQAFRINNLTAIKIPNSVTTIEAGAFINNSLTEVELGSSVESIGATAFTTHSGEYAGGNRITTVINKSGNSFDWDSIFQKTSTDGNSTFATGTYRFYDDGDQTIEITDGYTNDDLDEDYNG